MIVMPNVENGMGAVLFCRAGRPECLEIVTFGDASWDGVFDGFSITQVEKALRSPYRIRQLRGRTARVSVSQSGAKRCKPSQLVAGERACLCSTRA